MKTIILMLCAAAFAAADVVDVWREQGRDPFALQGNFGTGWYTFTGNHEIAPDGSTAFEYKTEYDSEPTWLIFGTQPSVPAPVNLAALTYLDAWKGQPAVPPQYVDHIALPTGPAVPPLPSWIAPIVQPYCPPGVPEVPEPSTMALGGLAFAGIAYKLKRKEPAL